MLYIILSAKHGALVSLKPLKSILFYIKIRTKLDQKNPTKNNYLS